MQWPGPTKWSRNWHVCGSRVFPRVEIGKQLGVSKNAVVGKAHRLGLTGRPSPIKRTAPKPKTEKQASLVDLGPNCCRWPIGDPRDAGFHFCGKKALPGKALLPGARGRRLRE